MSFLDTAENFAYARVTVAPNPATSGTSITLDDATNFPDPATTGAYNIVIWPNNTSPLSTNAEIVRVTAKTTNTLTITREQESTEARVIVENDQVMLAVTKKTVTDISSTIETGWIPIPWTVRCSTPDSPTFILKIDGDYTSQFTVGGRIKFTQTCAYTNDPASGSNIVLEMSDTTGFVVGNVVTVSSSAGTETATITVITTNTSITVNALALNHTTTAPLITFTKYFIITALTYTAPDTIITVYGGTDYKVFPYVNAINPYYSMMKFPKGFPADISKWTVTVTSTSNAIQNPASANTWYNIGSYSIVLPIGVWLLSYSVQTFATFTNGTKLKRVTLSTANNSESDVKLSVTLYESSGTASILLESTDRCSKILSVSAKTTYYLNALGGTYVGYIIFNNAVRTMVIDAVCQYF